MPPSLSAAVEIRTTLFCCRPLAADEVPKLQALFDANPEYFQTVNGRPALANEAQLEFDEYPPPDLGFSQRWFLGVYDPSQQQLHGVAVVVSDLVATGVWHLALLWLTTAWHGQGAGQQLWQGLEHWMQSQGAQWLRLGVVCGNLRAERFWQRQGFVPVRLRHGIDTGGRLNTVAVLVKPLHRASVADYLALVPRDRPEATETCHTCPVQPGEQPDT